jgi:hypothetical protein
MLEEGRKVRRCSMFDKMGMCLVHKCVPLNFFFGNPALQKAGVSIGLPSHCWRNGVIPWSSTVVAEEVSCFLWIVSLEKWRNLGEEMPLMHLFELLVEMT